jgi:DNA polymerase
MKLWCDLETFSEVPITHGSHAYAEKAEVLLFAYAVDDGEVKVWDCTASQRPAELARLLAQADEVWWHNCMFDRVVLKWAMPGLFELMPAHKWRDTLVQALAHGLPGKLDTLCEIFKLDAADAKDKRGKQLIQMFCKPQPKNQKLRRKTRETHPAEWAEFIEYAKSDIRSMRVLHDKIPRWNYPGNATELGLWHLDQDINMRGFYVDKELSEKAIEAVNVAQAALADQTHDATGGAVGSATQRDKLLEFILAEHGVSLPDMRADTLERRLTDDSLPDAVRELLAIRLQASTSSVSKYKRVMSCVSSDGYLRGTIQFCGAQRTGRDAGRLFQPQNMMRPTLKQPEIDFGIRAVKAGCADLITDNVMELTANCMRGVVIVPPEHKIVVADLANIEGRFAAWLAGEGWKLQAFRDYDTIIGLDDKGKPIRKGPDLYVKSYSASFGVDEALVTAYMRQIGKVQELMLQYGGGVGAYLTGAATYRIDLDELTEVARDSIPFDVWAEAENFWQWSKDTKRNTYGLSRETFMVCDSLKRMWRRANPAIAGIWGQYENAARLAIGEPGKDFPVGPVKFRRDGNWLRVRLPSGRYLCYPAPRNDDGVISYMGINQYSRKWQRIKTYGGKFFENFCQGGSRDVMLLRMPDVEAAGFEVVLRVHDELVTYAPDKPAYSVKWLCEIMSREHEWAKGLPLAAAGFEGYRYRKD